MRRLFSISLVAATAVLSTAPWATAQQQGGTLTVAHFASMPTSDPHFLQQQSNSSIFPHVYEMLVTVGEDMGPTLQLAESYELLDDGVTYSFKLREGVPFHNGDIMTSADVLASWQRYKDKSPGASSLAPVVEMTAPDDMTFVIRLDKPNPLFLESIISPTYPIAIIPAEEAAKEQGQIDPIGTGPYVFTEIIADDRIVLDRFEDYALDESAPEGFNGYAGRKNAYLDRIIYQIIPEPNSRASALEAGAADFTSQVPVATIQRLTATGNFQDVTFRQFAKALFPMNTVNGPTADVKVRQAIQAAANMEEIMTIAWEGLFQLDPGLLFSNSVYYDASKVEPYYNIGDVERAKALLAESSYNGEPIFILANAVRGNQNMALVLREQLLEAGINAEINFTDNATFGSNMMGGTGDWHVSALGYAAQPLSGPAAYFPVLRAHSQIGDSDEIFNELTAQWLSEPDLEARAEIWQQIETHVLEQAYYMVAGDRGITQVAVSDLKGFEPFYSLRFWNTWLE